MSTNALKAVADHGYEGIARVLAMSAAWDRAAAAAILNDPPAFDEAMKQFRELQEAQQ